MFLFLFVKNNSFFRNEKFDTGNNKFILLLIYNKRMDIIVIPDSQYIRARVNYFIKISNNQ